MVNGKWIMGNSLFVDGGYGESQDVQITRLSSPRNMPSLWRAKPQALFAAGQSTAGEFVFEIAG
jgi:hypothetical protein